MVFFRTIPVMLIDNEECFKTIKFNKKIYMGDPINILKIYSELCVDEIIIYDISKKDKINFDFLKKISDEAFVPLTYGGGIKSSDDVEKIIKIGFEKIIVNSLALDNLNFVSNLIKDFGSSSINISVNLNTNFFGKYQIYDYRKKKNINIEVFKFLKDIEKITPGEIVISFVNKEGTRGKLDIDLLKKIRSFLNCNIIPYGGLSSEDEILNLKKIGFNGVAASTLFSYKNSFDSLLINYISESLKEKLYQNEKV